MNEYMPRLVDSKLTHLLNISPIVLVEGPRACGKTLTAKHQANSLLDLSVGSADLARAELAPESALDGAKPRLIDEYQNLPAVWDLARRAVDNDRVSGSYIFTGSALPEADGRRHTGAGRAAIMRMRPMSLLESGESTGQMGLRSIFDGTAQGGENDKTVTDVVNALVRGGWPGWIRSSADDGQRLVESYIDLITERDFATLSGARPVPQQLQIFMAAYADLVAHPASFNAIEARIAEQGQTVPTTRFVSDFYEFLTRLYVIEDLPAWSPSMRSKSVALQTPKRHFVDPSLAAASMQANTDKLLGNKSVLGCLFESLVLRDLRIYAEIMRARGVYHFRDTKGRDEIDIVVEARNGDWIGCEVKLSMEQVSGAIENLERVAAKMVRPPKALLVIVPTGKAFKTASGTWVVPLTTLGV